jgi:hypothetical protein
VFSTNWARKPAALGPKGRLFDHITLILAVQRLFFDFGSPIAIPFRAGDWYALAEQH